MLHHKHVNCKAQNQLFWMKYVFNVWKTQLQINCIRSLGFSLIIMVIDYTKTFDHTEYNILISEWSNMNKMNQRKSNFFKEKAVNLGRSQDHVHGGATMRMWLGALSPVLWPLLASACQHDHLWGMAKCGSSLYALRAISNITHTGATQVYSKSQVPGSMTWYHTTTHDNTTYGTT